MLSPYGACLFYYLIFIVELLKGLYLPSPISAQAWTLTEVGGKDLRTGHGEVSYLSLFIPPPP